MYRTVRTLAALLLLGGLLALTAHTTAADDKPKDKGEEPKESDKKTVEEYTAAIGRAYALAEFGRKNKSPEALLMAAAILKKVPRTIKQLPQDVEVTTEKDPDVKDDAPPVEKARGFKEQSDDLKQEALDMVIDDGKESGKKVLGKDLDDVQKLAKEVDDMAGSRNLVGGGIKMVARAMPKGATESITLHFSKGMGSMSFRANGSVHITIKRANGAVIASDTCFSGAASWFVNAKSEKITFHLKNKHGKPLNYVMYIQ